MNRPFGKTMGIVLLVVGLVLVVWAFMPQQLVPPMLPDDDSTPPASFSPATVPPTPTATALRNPKGNPVKVTIVSKTKGTLARTRLEATYLRPDGRLVPDPGTASWLAGKGWPKPGTLSRYNSIVAGHVSGGGKPDVFYRLPDVRRGDTVYIDYDSGDRVVVEVTINPVNVGKTTVTSDPKYDWVWESPGGKRGKTRRVVTLFTCNPESEHVGGHSVDNWVTQGKVTSVFKKK